MLAEDIPMASAQIAKLASHHVLGRATSSIVEMVDIRLKICDRSQMLGAWGICKQIGIPWFLESREY